VKLHVNGKPVDLPAPTPLLDYLRSLGVDPRAVAVEVNERILDRAEFAATTLRDGDLVEIVRMVGGGRGAPPRPRRARPRAPSRRP
jgi:thiamine biosynthesis protein ThiS